MFCARQDFIKKIILTAFLFSIVITTLMLIDDDNCLLCHAINHLLGFTNTFQKVYFPLQEILIFVIFTKKFIPTHNLLILILVTIVAFKSSIQLFKLIKQEILIRIENNIHHIQKFLLIYSEKSIIPHI